MTIQFERDEAKNRTNQAKHGVSFEIATRPWEDPHTWIHFGRFENGKDGFHTVGVVGGRALLTVIHTYRDDEGMEIVRIMRARRATRHDKKLTKPADLTPEMIEQPKALAALPEDQIDTDDIPEAPRPETISPRSTACFASI